MLGWQEKSFCIRAVNLLKLTENLKKRSPGQPHTVHRTDPWRNHTRFQPCPGRTSRVALFAQYLDFPRVFFVLKQSAAGGCKDGAGSSRPSLPAVLLPPLSVPVPAGPSPALRTLLQAQARSTDQRPPLQLLTDPQHDAGCF